MSAFFQADELWLLIGAAAALVSSVWYLPRLGHGRFSLALMAVCLAALTASLVIKGGQSGRCPAANPGDISIFVAWSLSLFYILVGSSYRMSLLGIFTAPVVLGLSLYSLYSGHGVVVERQMSRPWLEAHTALALSSYGSFTLSAIAAALAEIQSRRMKKHLQHGVLGELPPLRSLHVVVVRLLGIAFVLLSLSLVCGAVEMSSSIVSMPKFWSGFATWLGAGVLLGRYYLKGLPSSRLCAWSLLLYALAVVTLFWAR